VELGSEHGAADQAEPCEFGGHVSVGAIAPAMVTLIVSTFTLLYVSRGRLALCYVS
jgi:hypothetical protein